jgi:hypothetical protein
MPPILIIQNLNMLSQLKNERIIVETGNIERIELINDTVSVNNHLFCIKLCVNQNITSISFKEDSQHHFEKRHTYHKILQPKCYV